jgi:hypothetical protein
MSLVLPDRRHQKDVAPDEALGDPELTPIVCCNCGAEYEGETESIPSICLQCESEIDLQTQFAFSRAVDAFAYGQQIISRISPKLRKRNPFTDDEMEGLVYYEQAYNSMQVSFQGQLAETQRRLAIEIMSAIAFLQLQHHSISAVEGAYWQALFKELSIQIEVLEVQEKLRDLPPGFMRLRWKLRLRQLNRSLLEMDEKITNWERVIQFAQHPRIRRKTLPSLSFEKQL